MASRDRAFQDSLYKFFRFRAGNQDVRGDPEAAAVEFGIAEDVLDRLVIEETLEVLFKLLRFDFAVGFGYRDIARQAQPFLNQEADNAPCLRIWIYCGQGLNSFFLEFCIG